MIPNIFRFLLIVVFSSYFFGCQKANKIDDLSFVPKVTDADKAFSDVYKILDGTWKGTFHVFQDNAPQEKSDFDFENLTLEKINQLNLELLLSIDVQQIYQSKTPYFQTVNITDFYPKENKTVKSTGVNKVQDGKMWCVVKKPDETIIHEGNLKNKNTIIWQSQQQSPQKVEYFHEEVTADSYEIIGYGYYEGHSLEKTPVMWFYGKYLRQK